MFILTFFLIKLAEAFSAGFSPWGLAVPYRKLPQRKTSCFKNPLKNQNKSFGGFSNFQLIHLFMCIIFRSSLRLHTRFFFNTLHFTNWASLMSASTRAPRTYPKIVILDCQKYCFSPMLFRLQSLLPNKKVSTFDQSELRTIYVTWSK